MVGPKRRDLGREEVRLGILRSASCFPFQGLQEGRDRIATRVARKQIRLPPCWHEQALGHHLQLCSLRIVPRLQSYSFTVICENNRFVEALHAARNGKSFLFQMPFRGLLSL